MALAAPVLASLAIVASHLMVARAFDLSNWEHVLVAGVELIAAYGFVALATRRDLLRRLAAVRAIFAAS